VTTVVSFQIAGREEALPPRQSFLEFPMHLAEWHGEPMAMERQYVDVLRFDDYLLANYQGAGGPINVYAAYYRSQKSGQATHSPKTCIPGGGWEIASFDEVAVPAGQGAESGFLANRVVIQKGDQKQVVLYWFKQRNRLVTSEYLVKFFLLWDSLTIKRSDGALIRLVAAVQPGETEGAADQRVMQMAAVVHPLLPAYVPD
jgi:EpsI family protein